MANPASGSADDLLQALGSGYASAVHGALYGAAVVEFANHDTFLVIDNGNGMVGADDFVIKLVGYVPHVSVSSGNVVFYDEIV